MESGRGSLQILCKPDTCEGKEERKQDWAGRGSDQDRDLTNSQLSQEGAQSKEGPLEESFIGQKKLSLRIPAGFDPWLGTTQTRVWPLFKSLGQSWSTAVE